MSNTYEICDVTVTLPALGSVISDSAGNEGYRGEKCRVNLYAVHPNWREKGSTFDGLMVGRTTFEGYTASPYNRTLRIMMPQGYKLLALRVDERDQPESWDSLPVHFCGGYIGRTVDALDEIADLPLYKISSEIAIQQKIADALDTALARHYEQFGNSEPEKTAVYFLAGRWVAIKGSYTADEISDAVEHIKHRRLTKEFGKGLADLSPFTMKDGQVFIKDAVIQNVQVSRNETQLRKAISDVVSEALRKNLQPGGTIWTSLRRGI